MEHSKGKAVCRDILIKDRESNKATLILFLDMDGLEVRSYFNINKTAKGYSAKSNSKVKFLYESMFGHEPKTRRVQQYAKHFIGKEFKISYTEVNSINYAYYKTESISTELAQTSTHTSTHTSTDTSTHTSTDTSTHTSTESAFHWHTASTGTMPQTHINKGLEGDSQCINNINNQGEKYSSNSSSSNGSSNRTIDKTNVVGFITRNETGGLDFHAELSDELMDFALEQTWGQA